eukprot:TRINITY_DN8198_c0_g1_i1.p1 TRINITY_DN8198_c0_g1~~TRINITY_DN8198_c0_g1_i1.p1  ORF type:complete len:217 (+),score=54.22 TRINITY_DN8198_c0_g1_i1:114-764(+)
MKRLFGIGKKEEEKPQVTLEDSMKMLDQRSDSLEGKIKQLDQEIVKQRNIMTSSKSPAARNSAKQRALQLMKRKKMYENQRDQMMTQSFNMEQASFTRQTMEDTIVQVQAMKSANQAIKSQFQDINIDEIEDLQDDMQELLDEANEIQEIMSRSYEMPYDVNEEDLEAELMDLQIDVEDEEIPSYLKTADLSSAMPDIQLPSLPQGQTQPVAATNQ